jgi:hypothetical protein
VKTSRRTALKGLGAFAAIPFMRALEASAATKSGPLRFMGIYYPHGASSPLYGLRTGESESSFDITYTNCILQPFDDATTYGRSFKDHLLILEGIDLSAAIAAGSTGHNAPPSLLTGCGTLKPTAPSIDQFLAVNRGLGSATRVTSVVLGVGWAGADPTTSISYGAGGAPLNKLIDPVQTFTTLFSGFVVPNPTDPTAQLKAQQQWKAGKSVLDYLNGDLTRLSARLAGPEKAKLDQHATALRDLEKRLGDLPTVDAGAPAAQCAVPAQPMHFPQVQSFNGGEPYFEQITNLQVDMTALAMACDITRFATLYLNDMSRGAYAGTGLTGIPQDCHQDLAHQYIGPIGGSGGNPATWAALGVHNRYSHSKGARFLQRCNEHGILDDVGMLMMSDMGDPSQHSSRDVPLMLAGGWGGQFRMGRHLKLVDDCPASNPYCAPPTLVSNARVLVSIAQAFGQMDVNTFGTGPDNTGPLPNLT